MALRLNYKKKEIIVIGQWDIEDLSKALAGKEDWMVMTENGIQLTLQKKKKYVYPYK